MSKHSNPRTTAQKCPRRVAKCDMNYEMGTFNNDVLRRGERRMHFDGNSFIVRNAGHSAGFDDKNQLKVY